MPLRPLQVHILLLMVRSLRFSNLAEIATGDQCIRRHGVFLRIPLYPIRVALCQVAEVLVSLAEHESGRIFDTERGF